MLSKDENRALTESGPGTPGGELLRRFWHPVALSEDLRPERPCTAVRVLGEDLVLFRDEHGRPGLLGRWCSHRGTDLRFGRIEDGGLRCVYHGWVYDTEGRCLEQPGEPPESRFHTKIKHTAYPCQEVNGVVYAYMGGGQPPLLPAFDWIVAPAPYVHAFKILVECNHWQAVEGNIDPGHHSFLHRFLRDAVPQEAVYARAFVEPAPGTPLPWSKIMRAYRTPLVESHDTDFGFRLAGVRDLGRDGFHVRMTNYVVPSAGVFELGEGTGLCLWHVPIDDRRHWRYEIMFSYGKPIDLAATRGAYLRTYNEDGTFKRNKQNDYLFDAAEQRDWTFAGVGYEFAVQDSLAIEGQVILDRTKENLGSTDTLIIKARRIALKLMKDLKEGREDELPLRLTKAENNHFDHLAAVDRVYPAGQDWRVSWKQYHLAIRKASPWASGLGSDGLSAV